MRSPLLAVMGALAAAVLPLPFSSARAEAAPCPPIAFGGTHESLDELAARTLHDLFEQGGRYESGGFFIEKDGVFHASRPVTQRVRRAVNYCIVLPRGSRLAGIYHTHVSSSELSSRDRRNAEGAGVASYVGTIRDRSIVIYDVQRGEVRPIDADPPSRLTKREDPVRSADSNSLSRRYDEAKRRAMALLETLARCVE